MNTPTKPTRFKIRLKKGDTVIVLAGKYKGKTGKVTATHPAENKVTVEGVNIVTKPIWVSKVAVIEPTSKKPSRIGYKVDKEGKKIRVYKRGGKEIK